MSKIKPVFSNVRIITPSGLGIVGGLLGKSDLTKRLNHMPVDASSITAKSRQTFALTHY